MLLFCDKQRLLSEFTPSWFVYRDMSHISIKHRNCHIILYEITPHQRIKYSTVVNILSSFLCYSLKVQSKSVLVNPFLLKSDNTPFVSSFSNVVVVTGPSAIQYSPTDCTRLAVTMLITAHLCLCNLLSFRFRSNSAFNRFFKTPIHAGDQHQSRIR